MGRREVRQWVLLLVSFYYLCVMRGEQDALEISKVWKEWDREKVPLIDVRSPGEFQNGHVPGAVNVPLFDNEERAVVGTLYKQEGKEEALMEGLDIVGPKMRQFVERAKALAPLGEIYTYCWRGGMRSNSMAWLWRTAGFEVRTVVGGYKGYRKWVHAELARPLDLISLGGRTGSSKTAMLHALRDAGEQILDLEGLAHHKGSVFGAIGEPPQPSSEYFENLLHEKVCKFDPQKRIWVEDESIHIGKVFIPQPFWKQMEQAPMMVVHVPLEQRVAHLVDVYTNIDHQLLKEAVLRIEKRLGGLATKNALEALERKDYAETARICLAYYDKAYDHGLKQKKAFFISELTLTENDPMKAARKLIALANERFPIHDKT